jgi:hypothetical protein
MLKNQTSILIYRVDLIACNIYFGVSYVRFTVSNSIDRSDIVRFLR